MMLNIYLQHWQSTAGQTNTIPGTSTEFGGLPYDRISFLPWKLRYLIVAKYPSSVMEMGVDHLEYWRPGHKWLIHAPTNNSVLA